MAYADMINVLRQPRLPNFSNQFTPNNWPCTRVRVSDPEKFFENVSDLCCLNVDFEISGQHKTRKPRLACSLSDMKAQEIAGKLFSSSLFADKKNACNACLRQSAHSFPPMWFSTKQCHARLNAMRKVQVLMDLHCGHDATLHCCHSLLLSCRVVARGHLLLLDLA